MPVENFNPSFKKPKSIDFRQLRRANAENWRDNRIPALRAKKEESHQTKVKKIPGRLPSSNTSQQKGHNSDTRITRKKRPQPLRSRPILPHWTAMTIS